MYVSMSIDLSPARALPCPTANVRTHPVRNLPLQYAAGTHLFREGDDAINLFEVVSGVVRLTRVLENGKRQVIAFGLPGDIVGFPNGTLHHTDCDVLSSAEILPYRRRSFEEGESDPETHRRLMRAALGEISAMQDHFMMLARKSAIEKVASFLSVLSARNGTPLGSYTTFPLPMCRADIADFLGMTIETVSRTITQLRKAGVIALDTPQRIIVLDHDALDEASLTDD